MIIRMLILILLSSPVFAQNSSEEINITDDQGKKQGRWVKYYTDEDMDQYRIQIATASGQSIESDGNKVKRYEGQFKDDKPYGVFKYYYPGGELRTELTYTKENRSTSKTFFPAGNLMAIGVYVGEVKDSAWTYYSIYGEKIALEYFIEGKLYGNCKKYHQNGEVLEERYFENDMENGPFKQYYENGNMSREATYVYGSFEGYAAFYFESGVLRFEGEYMKDTKNGIWKTYDEQGNLVDERMYIKGVRELRDSDYIKEDTSKYYIKDRLDESDFLDEDYMAIPEDDKKKKKKK